MQDRVGQGQFPGKCGPSALSAGPNLRTTLTFQVITRLPPAVCPRKPLLRARSSHLCPPRHLSAASSELSAAGTLAPRRSARVDPILPTLQDRRVQHRV